MGGFNYLNRRFRVDKHWTFQRVERFDASGHCWSCALSTCTRIDTRRVCHSRATQPASFWAIRCLSRTWRVQPDMATCPGDEIEFACCRPCLDKRPPCFRDDSRGDPCSDCDRADRARIETSNEPSWFDWCARDQHSAWVEWSRVVDRRIASSCVRDRIMKCRESENRSGSFRCGVDFWKRIREIFALNKNKKIRNVS